MNVLIGTGERGADGSDPSVVAGSRSGLPPAGHTPFAQDASVLLRVLAVTFIA